ncbi:MAG: molybdate importer periplasmic substrate-binding component [Pseudomonadota bacterium]|jgi:molybdate transport system substrate-binding protein
MLAGCALASAADKPLTVFAAASLTDVLEQIGRSYTAATGVPVRFSFAASSVLARQVEHGAPVDVFVSADQEWMDYLQKRELIAADTRKDIVSNSLVLVAPADSTTALRIAPGFKLVEALGPRGRLALADPGTVPAGRYAKAALGTLGVWESVAARVVPGDNVRTALNFVARGEAPLGIVYGTDARGEPKVRVVDTFPADSHAPIRYPAAALAGAGANARGFVQFLGSAEARAAFDKAGFGRP